jgi:hypothetical protein
MTAEKNLRVCAGCSDFCRDLGLPRHGTCLNRKSEHYCHVISDMHQACEQCSRKEE